MQLEQRQREEEEQDARNDRINAYADAMIRSDKIAPPYASGGDMTPDGRFIDATNRRVIIPQQQAIQEKYERTRKK